MPQLNILIGPSSFSEVDKMPLERLAHAGFKTVNNPYKRKLTREELKTLLDDDVCGIIAGLEPLDREVLHGTKLKVISRVGSGLSNVDLEYCREQGIVVCSTPDGPTDAVAELTLGAMLGLLREIPRMSSALHRGEWDKRIGKQLRGKTVAVIGYGRIGRRVAQLLRPFEVTLIVVDPCLTPAALTNERLMPLSDAISLADIITLHNSGETCLIAEDEIARMKPGVFLLNASRGGVISEAALAQGIQSGKIAGAWLDTFVQEPYRGILEHLPQVIITPHVGSYTTECRIAMENQAVTNLLKALGGNGQGA
jgi:D-3-phosphoglycerate dehydrogenase